MKQVILRTIQFPPTHNYHQCAQYLGGRHRKPLVNLLFRWFFTPYS